MKKLLITFLLFVSYSAWAEWELVGRSSNGEVAYYVDPTTIRKDGALRKFWKATNLKNRNQNGDMSWRSREEIDCKEERYRLVSMATFTNTMLTGKVTDSIDGDLKLEYIAPRTLDAAVMRYVCDR